MKKEQLHELIIGQGCIIKKRKKKNTPEKNKYTLMIKTEGLSLFLNKN